VTWLNDAVLLAPAVLLDARTGWEPAGDDGFRVSVTDAGRTVSAQVFLDDEGRPRDFRTEDRWADLPGRPVGRPSGTCPTASGPVLRAPAGRGRRDGEAVAASVRRLRRREDGGECHRDLRRPGPDGVPVAEVADRCPHRGDHGPFRGTQPRRLQAPGEDTVATGAEQPGQRRGVVRLVRRVRRLADGTAGEQPQRPARRTAACRWARSRAGSSQLPW
jgi:hypothetical protein